MLWIAITPFVKPDDHLIKTIIFQSKIVDKILLRLDANHQELMNLLNILINEIPKEQLIVHSDIAAADYYQIKSIHFKDGSILAKDIKAKHPDMTVSMSVHSVERCIQAQSWHLDFGLYSPLFKTPSKPNQLPRTDKEISAALAVGFPLVALGGIDESNIEDIPEGFIGIAAIRLFQQDLSSLKRLREEQRLRNTIS